MIRSLAIDSSTSRISISAQNSTVKATVQLEAGMRQSERLLPAIEYVLAQVELKPHELEYTACTNGPGSFTGLRLSVSALKGLEAAYGIPIYGIPTLHALAYPFLSLDAQVLPVIDAKKNRFFVAMYKNGIPCFGPVDYSVEQISGLLAQGEAVLVLGNDAPLCVSQLQRLNPKQRILALDIFTVSVSEALLDIAQSMHANNAPPLQKNEGPYYIRKSEAEEAC